MEPPKSNHRDCMSESRNGCKSCQCQVTLQHAIRFIFVQLGGYVSGAVLTLHLIHLVRLPAKSMPPAAQRPSIVGDREPCWLFYVSMRGSYMYEMKRVVEESVSSRIGGRRLVRSKEWCERIPKLLELKTSCRLCSLVQPRFSSHKWRRYQLQTI